MFKLLQILSVLLFLVGVVFVFYYRKKRAKRTVAVLCLLAVFSAGVANMVLGWIPMATEQITLTAKGEKSEKAQKDEVALVGVIADGKTYEINNAIEGKWFWHGNQYMWRNEGDMRQPKGTTRSITLNIPIGAGRALVFNNSVWRGMVDITFKSETKTYDLYSEKNQDVRIAIPETSPLYDNAVKVGRLALFGIFMLIFMTYPLFAAIRFSDEKMWGWVERNWDKIFFFTLSILYVLLMQKNSVDGSLWGDEMEQLGWAYGKMPVRLSLFIDGLYEFWVAAVPYGQENLLLLPQLFVAMSIYLCGVMGSRMKGKRFGTIFSSVMAFSVVVAEQCAMEFRPYPVLLFFTTLTAYVFVCMQQERKHSTLSILLYGTVLALTMDSHQFGIAVAGLIMVFDFLLIVLKRRQLKWLWEFVLPGIYGIYWLSTTFLADYMWLKGGYGVARWLGKPDAKAIFRIVKWLCNNSDILTLMALAGVLSTVILIVCHVRDGCFNFNEDYINVVFIFVPVTVMFVIWAFSAKAFPHATLLVDRYFISCEIFLLFFISVGINLLIDLICLICKTKEVEVGCTIFAICALCIFNWTKVSPWTLYESAGTALNHHFREAAEYLMSRNDIYGEDTLCVIDHEQESTNQAMEYYLTQKGKRDQINHVNIRTPLEELRLRDGSGSYKKIYITDVYRGYRSNSALNEFLEEKYTQADSGTNYVKLYVRKDG